MSRYKTILFDWEGVIGPQDTRSFGWLMQRLSSEYNVNYEQAVAALSGNVHEFMIGKIDNHTFWQRVGATLGVTFTKDFEQTIWQEWHGATPLPEMIKLVKSVKETGYRTVVFSNILPPSAARIREVSGYDAFDATVLSFEVGLSKPNAAMHQKALEAAECTPEECIFIDDKAVNLTPAQQLGMTTILAKSSDQIQADLLQLLNDT